LEDHEAQWLRQEAVTEMRRRLAARPPEDPVRQALVRRLVRLNNNWLRLAGELEKLLARRDTLEDFLRLAGASGQPEAYARLVGERFGLLMRGSLAGLRAALANTALGRDWEKLVQELRATGAPAGLELPGSLPGVEPAELPGWQAVAQALLTQEGKVRRSFTEKLGFPKGFKTSGWPEVIGQIPEVVAGLLHDCRGLASNPPGDEEIEAVQDLVLLLAEALKVWEELCAQKGVLDFIALEQAALRLLSVENPNDLLLKWDYRLRHLLVDEFQDTSINQLELLCRLLSGWEGNGGRSLMVVGDPKQSIYGFRQAKLRLFLEARRGLPCRTGRLPLKALHLRTNFRASRTLIEWVNRVFAAVLNDPGAPEKLDFHPAVERPGAEVGEAPRLALFAGEDRQAARLMEGRGLARQVAEALQHRGEKESLGILLFARTHLPTYLMAFQEAGVTVRVREGLRLADSLVVKHLHNLAKALVIPHDEVAWAAVLRGPWGKFGLDVLVGVAGCEGELWPVKLRRFAEKTACPPEFARLVGALAAALGRVGRKPLVEILQDFLRETGAWPGVAAWEGPAGVANAEAYLELLTQAESYLPEKTYQKADFYLTAAFQPPDPRSQESPVELLTVHGAKGLEFDQVFVPFLDWRPLTGEEASPPFLLEEIPEQGLAVMALAKPYAAARQSSLYQVLKQVRNRRILAEARRLFYVAATRAKKRLYFSAFLPTNRRGERRPPPDSPLAWLWGYYQPGEPVPGVTNIWPEPELVVDLYEDYPSLTPPERSELILPTPLEVRPEEAPYSLQFPSQTPMGWASTIDRDDNNGLSLLAGEERGLVGEDREFWGMGEEAELSAAEVPRVRGEICHRLLETAAQGRPLPEAQGVAAALRQKGLASEEADRLAGEILAEVRACLEDTFLGRLLSPDWPVAVSEWLVEDETASGVIRRGRLDRVVYDGKCWWLLDFKTGRPEKEEDWEDFVAAEVERYRPQVEAYREMAAKFFGLDSGAEMRLVLYFTANRRAVELS